MPTDLETEYRKASIEYAELIIRITSMIDQIRKERDLEEELEPIGAENLATHHGRLGKMQAADSLIEELQTKTREEFENVNSAYLLAKTAPTEAIETTSLERFRQACDEINLYHSVIEKLQREVERI